MTYLFIIALASVLIALGNFLADGVYTEEAFFALLLSTLLGVLAVVLLDGLLAFVIRRLPEGWFAPERGCFAVSEKEAHLYRRLKINKWKRYVPELGCFTGFHKDTLGDTKSSSYLGRFLLESNYGVLGHIAGAVFGFLILLLPFLRPRTVALPIALVNFVLNLLPTAILRANTPALRRLYQRSLAKENKEAQNDARKGASI